MSIRLIGDAIIIKSFNNNIILTKVNGKEKIIFGRGIGFSKKFGDKLLDGTEVEKIFSIESKDNIRSFSKLVDSVDKDFMAICEEAIYEISKCVDSELDENIHIGLIDHLSFAVKRLKNHEEIQNPFIVEVETLYNKEYELAKLVAEKVGKYSNVVIPEGEIGFIALHIHSAINNGHVSKTLKYNYLSKTVVEYVEKELEISIDKKSLDYARFLTHMRFAIERMVKDLPVENELIDVIKKKYEKSYDVANEVAKIIKDQLSIGVTDDEVAYLAMHIERFRITK